MDKTLEMIRLINSVSYNLDMLLSKRLLEENMAITEFKTLFALLEEGDMSVQEMAKRVFLTSGSMTYITDKLVKKGYIEKKQQTNDLRVFMLTLTKDGKDKIKSILLDMEPVVDGCFENYKSKDKDRLIKILNKTKL